MFRKLAGDKISNQKSVAFQYANNEYCKIGYTAECNLYVQCNHYQNSNDILHQERKFNPNIHMEAKKT
jgi:hypothetical protein